MIGEAPYVVDPCDPTTGEFAITVADGWQLHGLARNLLDRLERQAATSGIERMVARHGTCASAYMAKSGS